MLTSILAGAVFLSLAHALVGLVKPADNVQAALRAWLVDRRSHAIVKLSFLVLVAVAVVAVIATV